jgi:Flp pilus assembly protein TadB
MSGLRALWCLIVGIVVLQCLVAWVINGTCTARYGVLVAGTTLFTLILWPNNRHTRHKRRISD